MAGPEALMGYEHMNLNKTLGLTLGVLALATLTTRPAHAAFDDISDTWITTKAKITLLTADGAGRMDVKVETDHGAVTIHGKVESEAVKDKATRLVKEIDGVKSVRNLVEVVPASAAKAVKASDKEIRECVETGLKAHKTLGDVHVDSVDNALVFLGGKTRSLDLQLVAIETAYNCPGTRRVASKIEVEQK